MLLARAVPGTSTSGQPGLLSRGDQGSMGRRDGSVCWPYCTGVLNLGGLQSPSLGLVQGAVLETVSARAFPGGHVPSGLSGVPRRISNVVVKAHQGPVVSSIAALSTLI